MLARYSEVVGCCLSSKRFVLRDENDCFLFGHEPHNASEMAKDRLWDVGLLSVFVDEGYMPRFGKGFGKLSQLILGNQRRINTIVSVSEHTA